ncbi:growth-regulating factor 4 [Brassica rapa]|uniref:growth-regulating factor 4 n=1 Tax=Brassica campestris TaxID=3711 RepID=UPI00142DFA97|nr:growth-regulating factor 4 [Brassica rapa]
MDLQLKQWRSQQQNESEEQGSATKMSSFFFDQIQSQTETSAAALPLFVPEPTSSSSFSCFTPDSSSSSTRHLKMGNFFSLAQWQELELQALIYRYMLAGASVPQELLLPIKKSLFHQSPLNFLQHPLQHNFPHHQASWYWGRGAMDPEPGRCKRTDGKKWRCSRDVVGGHKYCDRHIHRGRNRSRKPVETTAKTATTNAATNAASSFVLGEELGHGPNNLFFSSGSSHHSSPHLHLNSHQSCPSDMNQESNNNKRPYETRSGFSNGRSDDGHILRPFFDDWPRSSDSTSSPLTSSTCHLSISMPGNPPSDVSLKLSTGNEEEEEANMRNNNNNEREQQQNMNWWSSGGNHNNMGGPLAEALRSASSTSSVLQQMGISTQVFH